MTQISDSEQKQAAIECPSCKKRQSVRFPPQRAADEFCDNCGYPMFWAIHAELEAHQEHAGLSGSALRRPGEAGFASLGAEPCPVCNELNPQAAVFCQRCGSPMQPQPEPEPEPEPEPVAVWVPVPVPTERVIGYGVAAVAFLIVVGILIAPINWVDAVLLLFSAAAFGGALFLLFRVYEARREIEVMLPEEAEAAGYEIAEDYLVVAEGTGAGHAEEDAAVAAPQVAAAAAGTPPGAEAPAVAAAASPTASPKAPKKASAVDKGKATQASLRDKKLKAQGMAGKARSIKGRVKSTPGRFQHKLNFFQRLKRFF